MFIHSYWPLHEPYTTFGSFGLGTIEIDHRHRIFAGKPLGPFQRRFSKSGLRFLRTQLGFLDRDIQGDEQRAVEDGAVVAGLGGERDDCAHVTSPRGPG
jgi:hypothetical protein